MNKLDNRFATALKNLSDAPPPLAEAIRQFNEISETPDVLIFSPAFTTMDICRPASLLALTRTHWAIATQSALSGRHSAVAEAAAAFGSDYGHTLAVELSILLLDGRLALHGAGIGPGEHIIYFNTVMEKIYRDAAFFSLNQIASESINDRRVTAAVAQAISGSELSMKFKSALERFTPPGEKVISYVAWPVVFGGFHRQFAPAAMLVRTSRFLILISDDPPTGGLFHNPQQNLGYVVTYMPLQHIRGVALGGDSKLTTLEINLAAGRTSESVAILVPNESMSAVERVAGPA